ncbi:MAG: Gfo/Idh/MocA family protein, partial [Spirochaetota bacterium]
KRVRLGAAPDTFLGGGLQTVRKLVDDGWIGTPIAATAFMTSHGPEGWHPNPAFFYRRGAGPLFDMGPYYITTLVSLLGPVKRLSAATRTTFAERVATTPERYGEKIPVEVPTYVAGTLEFESGAIGTLVMSFDVWKSRLPRIDLFGELGSIGVPDPNTFGGPVELFRPGGEAWAEVPLSHGYSANSRGVGLLDMARAVESGRPHRAAGEMSLHVLEVMHGLLESGETASYYEMTTSCERPAPLPVGLNDGEVDSAAPSR